jgi:hypothetical protein
MHVVYDKFDDVNTCSTTKTYCKEVIFNGNREMTSNWWKSKTRTTRSGSRAISNADIASKKRGREAGSDQSKRDTKKNGLKNNVADARRQHLKENIAGVPLVYRLGNPSLRPWSQHEKSTLDEAIKFQGSKSQKSSFAKDEPKAFFDSCGFRIKCSIFPPSLEEQVIDRTVDLIIETEERGSTRSSNVQQFCEPCGVGNRELYLVSSASCEQIKMQNGSPFMDGKGGSKVAWALKGQRIQKFGTDELISPSSLAITTGSALLPDVKEDTSHPQNLDNPKSKPFLDVFNILKEEFSAFLSNENEDDVYGRHDKKFPLMCLQLIIGEAGRGREGGRRGPHEDKWATTGAAVIGASVCNPRQIKMKHGFINATYDLPRGSAYILSGAARYGTIWGLTTPLEHALEAFTPGVSDDAPVPGANDSEGESCLQLQHREHYERKTRRQCEECVAIRPRVIDPDMVMTKEDPTTPYSCIEFDAMFEFLCSSTFNMSSSKFEKGKSVRDRVHQTPNQQYGRLLPTGVQVSPVLNLLKKGTILTNNCF